MSDSADTTIDFHDIRRELVDRPKPEPITVLPEGSSGWLLAGVTMFVCVATSLNWLLDSYKSGKRHTVVKTIEYAGSQFTGRSVKLAPVEQAQTQSRAETQAPLVSRSGKMLVKRVDRDAITATAVASTTPDTSSRATDDATSAPLPTAESQVVDLETIAPPTDVVQLAAPIDTKPAAPAPIVVAAADPLPQTATTRPASLPGSGSLNQVLCIANCWDGRKSVLYDAPIVALAPERVAWITAVVLGGPALPTDPAQPQAFARAETKCVAGCYDGNKTYAAPANPGRLRHDASMSAAGSSITIRRGMRERIVRY